MNYIKVGTKYINLDAVTSIEPVSKEFAGAAGMVTINFAGRMSEESSVWLEADEAVAFLDWLNLRAVDIMDVISFRDED